MESKNKENEKVKTLPEKVKNGLPQMVSNITLEPGIFFGVLAEGIMFSTYNQMLIYKTCVNDFSCVVIPPEALLYLITVNVNFSRPI